LMARPRPAACSVTGFAGAGSCPFFAILKIPPSAPPRKVFGSPYVRS
jgi:hypothetical protein